MLVSGQQERQRGADASKKDKKQKGPRARMNRIMLDAAMRLMQEGLIPSVTDVAEAAQVSRATAYRYYPSQAALIQASVDEALGPILGWQSDSQDSEQRMRELLTFAYPRMEMYEATLKAALRLALDQWARRHAGSLGEEAPMQRGHRIGLLASAISPLKSQLGSRQFERLSQGLSLIFGTEAFVVLKDIWGLDRKQAEDVALWTCHALIRSAIDEAGGEAPRKTKTTATRKTSAARRTTAPRKRAKPAK